MIETIKEVNSTEGRRKSHIKTIKDLIENNLAKVNKPDEGLFVEIVE